MIEGNTNARTALRLAVDLVAAKVVDEAETIGLAESYMEWLNEQMEQEAPKERSRGTRSGTSSKPSRGRSSSRGSSKGDGEGPPTEKQVNWAKRLLKDRDHDLDVRASDLDDMTFGEVSDLIENLMQFERTD